MRWIGLRFVIAVCYMVCPAEGFSQKASDLSKPAGKEWLTIGGDWHNTRYSALNQINRSNVKNLKGAWVTHLGSGLGQKYSFEGTPIVKDGILYIATGNDDVFAPVRPVHSYGSIAPASSKISLRSAVAGTTAALRWGTARFFSASSTAISSPLTSRPAGRSGERSLPAGRMVTPSPLHRCSTTVWSIPAFPAEIGRRAASSRHSTQRPARKNGASDPSRRRANSAPILGRSPTIPTPSKPMPGNTAAPISGKHPQSILISASFISRPASQGRRPLVSARIVRAIICSAPRSWQ